MRILIFVLSLIVTSSTFASAISGEVIRIDPAGFFLLGSGSGPCSRYAIIPLNESVTKNVRRLTPGDTITATGTFDDSRCSVKVESIEYVGLKKLLGYWYSNAGVISVPDYSSLNFYPIGITDLNSQIAVVSGEAITYRYSVTPTDGPEWVLFLSDKRGTTFATIEINDRNATMKLFDSETGDITQTLKLSKWWGNLTP